MKKLGLLFIVFFAVVLSYFVFAAMSSFNLDNLDNQTNSTTGNITFQCNATANAS
jgi:hypothetical protein